MKDPRAEYDSTVQLQQGFLFCSPCSPCSPWLDPRRGEAPTAEDKDVGNGETVAKALRG